MALTTISISWIPADLFNSDYQIVEYKLSSAATWTVAGIVSNRADNYILTGIDRTQAYQVRIGNRCGDIIVYGAVVDVEVVTYPFKWVLDVPSSYCESDVPVDTFSSLTTKSVTTSVGFGNSFRTLDNSTILINTLSGVNITTLNTTGSNIILTVPSSGSYKIEIQFSGSATVTANAGFYCEFNFFIEINGVKTALSSNSVTNPASGTVCQFYLISPGGGGTRTGSTAISGTYNNPSIELSSGHLVRIYGEVNTSITGASSVPLNMSVTNCKVFISKI